MYCPKCGKENLEDARFCMHCGADLSEYKVEILPKIEVSPKISVSAKAESGVALKWKQKPIKYAEIRGKGELSVYEKFIHGSGGDVFDIYHYPERFYCPQCGNYGSLVWENWVYEYLKDRDDVLFKYYYRSYKCQACGKLSLLTRRGLLNGPVTPNKYVYLDLEDEDKYFPNSKTTIGKVPIYYKILPACPRCGAVDKTESISPDFYGKIGDLRYNTYMKYRLYKCSVCKDHYLLEGDLDLEYTGDASYRNLVHPICEVCDSRKAEYTCSSCGKQLCENCVVKKGHYLKNTCVLIANR